MSAKKDKKQSGGNRFYSVMYTLLAGLLRRVYRLEVIGDESALPAGGAIVCSNHLSMHDVVVLIIAMRHRQLRFLAKDEIFHVPVIGPIVRAFGAYPIKRGKSDVGAIRKTIALVQSGETVGFFPQGKRYPGAYPSVDTVKPGVGMIAARTEAPLIPVAIVTKDFRMRFFHKTRVVIGEPIGYASLGVRRQEREDGEKIVSAAEYGRISAFVFEKIVELTEANRF